MNAICGIYRPGEPLEREIACAAMLEAQKMYAPHVSALRTSDPVSFGRALFNSLPEDRFDRQPLIGGEGRFLMVADVRLDNRPELAASLGLDGPRCAVMSDADMMMAAFLRWRDDVVHQVNGDYAFAAWDAHERRLLLVRDPLGQRPLCYYHEENAFVFASMPTGICASGAPAVAPDTRRVAEYMADLVYPHHRSFYDRISLVQPGHVVAFAAGRVATRRYWNPRRTELRLSSTSAYVEAFREHLDRSVRRRLRGGDGLVAAHLSAGYDSSAVATTAARLLDPQGGRVVAFTSAPREGFDGPTPRGRVNDESGVAARTAALYPNMEHVVLRPSGADTFSLLKDAIAVCQHPLGHVCNNVWWSAINQAAADRGIKVMLTGENGNLSISAGGTGQFADLIRTGQWLGWLRESRAFVKEESVSWRGVLANSFGPWLPRQAWMLLSHLFLKTSRKRGEHALLRDAWAQEMATAAANAKRELRPARDSYALRLQLLQFHDSGQTRKSSLAMWGIDERDPTADVALVEFCLSLPPDMLLRNGRRRPLARAALSDRLPSTLLDNRLRGYQMADWYEQITKEQVQAAFDDIPSGSAAGDVIDLDRLRRKIETWPTSGWENPSVIFNYRMDLLHAISAAYFMNGVVDGRSPSRT